MPWEELPLPFFNLPEFCVELHKAFGSAVGSGLNRKYVTTWEIKDHLKARRKPAKATIAKIKGSTCAHANRS